MLKQYAPSVASGKDYSEVLSAPYAGLQLFAKVADTAKLTPTSTPDDVKKGLYALKDETLGGLTVPLNYKEGQPTFLSCYFRTQYDGSKWVSTPKPICLTAAQTSAVKAAFGLSCRGGPPRGAPSEGGAPRGIAFDRTRRYGIGVTTLSAPGGPGTDR